MNYRHAFHAGNFADVMKHIALARVIEHLKLKDKPFRFIDTHAGTGLYDISGDEAERSGEWREGIGAVLDDGKLAPFQASPGSNLAGLLEPYFNVLRELNGATQDESRGLRYYPGAGELARRLMREDDRLVLNELHPDDGAALRQRMFRDERVRTLQLDGWLAVKSLLPPKERRSVMLIDPPFEQVGEFARLEQALSDAIARFATGTTMIWFPIKAGGASDAFLKRMAQSGHTRLLAAELLIRHRDTPQGLNGAGLLIHNPTYGLDQQLELILAWLSRQFGQSAGAGSNVRWLAGE
ncbi:MAG: 23S rRNA (adenine2030-N6)-methyltransferase [Hyphomicrobiaceae bacterium]|jgi:23S rRNA (adenine2030-N6)-methyltransferase